MKRYPAKAFRGEGAGMANLVARGFQGDRTVVVPPHLFGLRWPTSTRRRWSQLTKAKMQRETPHPRPWEGPRWDFSGVFFSAADAVGVDPAGPWPA